MIWWIGNWPKVVPLIAHRKFNSWDSYTKWATTIEKISDGIGTFLGQFWQNHIIWNRLFPVEILFNFVFAPREKKSRKGKKSDENVIILIIVG